MSRTEIYTKSWCPYCKSAKSLLDAKGLDYQEYDVTHDSDLESEMRLRSNRTSVPQVFVDGHHIGGFDDLSASAASGKLNERLRDGLVVA